MPKADCKVSDSNGVCLAQMMVCSNAKQRHMPLTVMPPSQLGVPNVAGQYSIEGNTITTIENNSTQKMMFKAEYEILTINLAQNQSNYW